MSKATTIYVIDCKYCPFGVMATANKEAHCQVTDKFITRDIKYWPKQPKHCPLKTGHVKVVWNKCLS